MTGNPKYLIQERPGGVFSQENMERYWQEQIQRQDKDAERARLLERIREGTQELFRQYSDPVELSWHLASNFVPPWEHHQRIERERKGRPLHRPSPLAVQLEPSVVTYRRIQRQYA